MNKNKKKNEPMAQEMSSDVSWAFLGFVSWFPPRHPVIVVVVVVLFYVVVDVTIYN